FNHQGMELSYNTRLPYLGETKRAYRVMNPDGSQSWIDKSDASQYDSVTDIPQPTGETLVETGKMFVGLHYLWAGLSGFRFDCPRFTFTIMQSHVITLPRDSTDQASYGPPVEFEDLQPGDLLFFAYENGQGRVHRVGLHAGDGTMLPSPSSKRGVEP